MLEWLATSNGAKEGQRRVVGVMVKDMAGAFCGPAQRGQSGIQGIRVENAALGLESPKIL